MTEPEQWISDLDDLTGKETDRALAMVGIGADQMGAHMMSMACAAAVVIAQRRDPAIPDERWETLKLKDLDIRQQADAADVQDPTSPA